MGLISRVSSRTYRRYQKLQILTQKMADQQAMMAGLQQLAQDPAALQQLQAEMGKAQVSVIHSKCFPQCVTGEVTVDRASAAQERCLIQCGTQMIQVSQMVKSEIDSMVQA